MLAFYDVGALGVGQRTARANSYFDQNILRHRVQRRRLSRGGLAEALATAEGSQDPSTFFFRDDRH